MIELSATIRNEQGIHCRPSAVIIKAIKNYPGDIRVFTENGDCDPRSVMALMSLCLHRGSRLRIRVSGPDEKEWVRKVVELFETEFDFPPRKDGEPVPEVGKDLS